MVENAQARRTALESHRYYVCLRDSRDSLRNGNWIYAFADCIQAHSAGMRVRNTAPQRHVLNELANLVDDNLLGYCLKC